MVVLIVPNETFVAQRRAMYVEEVPYEIALHISPHPIWHRNSIEADDRTKFEVFQGWNSLSCRHMEDPDVGFCSPIENAGKGIGNCADALLWGFDSAVRSNQPNASGSTGTEIRFAPGSSKFWGF